jgi:hypothetical protein
MRRVILLGLFVIMGLGAIIYDAVVLRPSKLRTRERHLALIAEAKRLVINNDDGFKPTPKEQVYDLVRESREPTLTALSLLTGGRGEK